LDALITIKSANISLLQTLDQIRYVVNLVDTPGHVDFSGKVTRAMRVIDGAIIVVDAVEGVMAQTENVLRTAIKESVRPVLFINKIDRLILELKLSPVQIQERLSNIIEQINELILESSNSSRAQAWKVDADENSVAFGSALHRWGFSLDQMHQMELKFQDILKYYANSQINQLPQILPVHIPIINMIIKKLPNPKEAQSYRIPHIWRGNISSAAGAALSQCDRDGPLIIGIAKIVPGRRHEDIAVGRIFSGTVRRGTMIRLLSKDLQSRAQRVHLFMGARRVNVNELTAGNICGLSGFPEINAGDTLTGISPPEGMVPFEKIEYTNEPVVTISIEPMHTKDLPRLLEYLEGATKRDPNLTFQVNEKTGENLLSGIGLLHLEIALKEIEKTGIKVEASEPLVLYRETPKQAVVNQAFHPSPNEKNEIKISLHPSSPEIPIERVLFKDDRENTLSSQVHVELSQAEKEALISGFRWATEKGPLCGEPLGLTLVKIQDIKLSEELHERSRVELMSMLKDAIFNTLENTGVSLLEPIYELNVSVPSSYLSEITKIIMSRRGQVEHVQHQGTLVVLIGSIPVSESFDLANTIRSQTSGRATWQTRFARWKLLPENLVEQISRNIKKRKGLLL
jgi:elongation factor 2